MPDDLEIRRVLESLLDQFVVLTWSDGTQDEVYVSELDETGVCFFYAKFASTPGQTMFWRPFKQIASVARSHDT